MNRKIALALFLAATAAAFYALDLHHQITLTSLKSNRESLLAYYEAHAAELISGYILLYTAVAGLSLPGATVLTLAGGAVFGALPATLIVNIGATLGATLAFLSARFLFRDWVEKRFGDRLARINAGFASGSGFNYLLFLRLVPLFPFFMINLACGLTRLPLRVYFLGTMLGILPGTFVYANAGSNLASIDALSDVASPGVLGALILLGLFSLIPAAYKRWRKPREDSPPAS